MAYSVLHSDNFNRADTSNIGGSTMSGGGTWSYRAGNNTGITSNVAYPLSGLSRYYDSAMSAVDKQRVTIDLVGNTACPAVRMQDSGHHYLYYTYSGSAATLFRMDGGYNSLGATGSTFVGGETCGIEANGTSISGYRNGSLNAGPATDSNYSTGRGGLSGDTGGALDNWQVEVESVATAPQPASIRRRNSLQTR